MDRKLEKSNEVFSLVLENERQRKKYTTDKGGCFVLSALPQSIFMQCYLYIEYVHSRLDKEVKNWQNIVSSIDK